MERRHIALEAGVDKNDHMTIKRFVINSMFFGDIKKPAQRRKLYRNYSPIEKIAKANNYDLEAVFKDIMETQSINLYTEEVKRKLYGRDLYYSENIVYPENDEGIILVPCDIYFSTVFLESNDRYLGQRVYGEGYFGSTILDAVVMGAANLDYQITDSLKWLNEHYDERTMENVAYMLVAMLVYRAIENEYGTSEEEFRNENKVSPYVRTK